MNNYEDFLAVIFFINNNTKVESKVVVTIITNTPTALIIPPSCVPFGISIIFPERNVFIRINVIIVVIIAVMIIVFDDLLFFFMIHIFNSF